MKDSVDNLIEQWANEMPRASTDALASAVRIQKLAKHLQSRTARALAHHGLKPWEYDVLSVLRRQGAPYALPATEIARAALLTSGAMTTRIDGLEARGLVSRRHSKLDKRSVIVRLTARGKRIIDGAIASRFADASAALDSLSGNDRKNLSGTLRKVLAALETD